MIESIPGVDPAAVHRHRQVEDPLLEANHPQRGEAALAQREVNRGAVALSARPTRVGLPIEHVDEVAAPPQVYGEQRPHEAAADDDDPRMALRRGDGLAGEHRAGGTQQPVCRRVGGAKARPLAGSSTRAAG